MGQKHWKKDEFHRQNPLKKIKINKKPSMVLNHM